MSVIIKRRCVVSEPWDDGVRVTTEDGDSKVYKKEELWTEAEWEAKYGNSL